MLPPFGKKYKTIHYKNKQRSIEISGINAEKVLRLGILAELQKLVGVVGPDLRWF